MELGTQMVSRFYGETKVEAILQNIRTMDHRSRVLPHSAVADPGIPLLFAATHCCAIRWALKATMDVERLTR